MIKRVSPRFLSTIERGREAARDGKSMADCPYKIAPYGCNRRNGGTWGAIWRHYWRQGFFEEKARLDALRKAEDGY